MTHVLTMCAVSRRRRRAARVVFGMIVCTAACIPKEYRPFFALPLDERREAILDYPLETQIEIYVITVTKSEPPDFGLAESLARNGAAIIPHVVRRVEAEESVYVQAQLVDVLWYLECRGQRIVVGEEALVRLSAMIDRADESPWKEVAKGVLCELWKGCGLPRCRPI